MKVTASRVALLQACQYPFRQDVEWPADNKVSEASAFGVAIHEMCDAYIAKSFVPLIRRTGEDSARMAAVWAGARAWIDANRDPRWLTEVPFAYNVDTDRARQLPKMPDTGHRAYLTLAGNELAGTADLCWYDAEAGVAYVRDWKTGWDLSYSGPQLRTLGLMAAMTWGARKANVAAIQLTPDGAIEADPIVLDDFQLAAVAGQITGLVAEIPKAEPQPGLHCTSMYCPARFTCPKSEAVVAELVPAEALVQHRFTHKMSTLEHAQAVLPQWKLARAYLERVEERLKDIARAHGGIPTSPGKQWQECTRRVPRYRGKDAVAMLQKYGASKEELDRVRYEHEERYFDERRVK